MEKASWEHTKQSLVQLDKAFSGQLGSLQALAVQYKSNLVSAPEDPA